MATLTYTHSSSSRTVIIIELNGLGLRYGYDDTKIHNQLIDHGFMAYGYDAFKRKLTKIEAHGDINTIYIREIEFIEERIRHAPRFNINSQEI